MMPVNISDICRKFRTFGRGGRRPRVDSADSAEKGAVPVASPEHSDEDEETASTPVVPISSSTETLNESASRRFDVENVPPMGSESCDCERCFRPTAALTAVYNVGGCGESEDDRFSVLSSPSVRHVEEISEQGEREMDMEMHSTLPPPQHLLCSPPRGLSYDVISARRAHSDHAYFYPRNDYHNRALPICPRIDVIPPPFLNTNEDCFDCELERMSTNSGRLSSLCDEQEQDMLARGREVRLRRREAAAAAVRSDAIEAGFEPAGEGGGRGGERDPPAVTRSHSTHSVSFAKSQFTPSLDLNDSLRNVGIDYTPAARPMPMHHRSSRCNRDAAHDASPHSATAATPVQRRLNYREATSVSPLAFTAVNRRSLQTLNTSGGYANLGPQYREEQHDPGMYYNNAGHSSTPHSHRHHTSHTATRLAVANTPSHNSYGDHPAHVVSSSSAGNYRNGRHRHDSSMLDRRGSMNGGGIVATSASGHHPSLASSSSHHAYLGTTGYRNTGYDVDDNYGRQSPGGGGGGSSMTALEQRVRELEAALLLQQRGGEQGGGEIYNNTPRNGHRNTPRLPGTTHVTISNGALTPSVISQLEKKDHEILALQERLEKQQQRYEDEIRLVLADKDNAMGEHVQLKNRLDKLLRELDEYKEKVASASSGTSQRILEKDEEVRRLHEEKERLEKEKEEMKREKEEKILVLQQQKEALLERCEKVEEEAKRLEETLMTLRMEQSMYQQSCSSGSTPLADEVQSSFSEVRTPIAGGSTGGDGQTAFQPTPQQGGRSMRYTKAHSTLGASGITITPSSSSASPSTAGGTPKTGGGLLSKSLSNYNMDGAGIGRAKELPPNLSLLIRKQQKQAVKCRLLVHNLRDVCQETLKGKTPDARKLVGVPAAGDDSNSESEPEVAQVDGAAMPFDTTESYLKRHEADLERVEAGLEEMRRGLIGYHGAHVKRDIDNEACRVQ